MAQSMPPRFVVSSSRRFTSRLTPVECAHRLNQRFRPLVSPGRADQSGFWVATGLRTAILLRGTFTPLAGGLTRVDSWVELRPYLVWAWLAVTPLSVGVLIAGLIVARIPLFYLWPFIPVAALGGAINAYLSYRQAQRLRRFVQRELGHATDGGDLVETVGQCGR